MLENLSVVIPKNLENLQLPDPDLLHQYEDEEARRIYLEGAIGTEEDIMGENSTQIIKRILRYNREDKGTPINERKPILLFIDSGGGSGLECVVMANLILQSKTPVYTINMCCAYSAAGILLSCGHKRFALRGSTVLIHTYSAEVDGTRENIENQKRFFDKLDKRIVEVLTKQTKVDSKMYRQKAPKNWYLDDEECLKYGVIDKIVEDIDEIL